MRRSAAVLAGLLLASGAPAHATTVAKICRTMCAPARAACGDDEACGRALVRRCRRSGPAVCAPAYCDAMATTTTTITTTTATRPSVTVTSTTAPGRATTTTLVSGRFIDRGDGTVYDVLTGLLWERKDAFDGVPDPANPHDADNLYPMAAAPPGGVDVGAFLAQLDGAGGACFAGLCDWRLPTLGELQSVQLQSFPCTVLPCIDPTFGPTAADFYWSSTPLEGEPAYRWGVYFGYGSLGLADVIDPEYVRAVHGP